MRELILGGVRSGKSRLAESLATQSGMAVTYIATARIGDEGMRKRVEAHRHRRPADWTLVEEPIALARALKSHAAEDRCLIVDCLTLWLTQLLCEVEPSRLDEEKSALLAELPALPGRILLIGNETNMGVMPLGELSRRYCDEAGVLHQKLAQVCDRVMLTVAGLPWVLKGAAL
ncbi:bifunctional adenosylcobinamide kinase/adenosylcobinamide-phosphate guanylyltransferase [Methylococcus sp. EFPC2]|uniref:bifunctional adenosylcobinamide kinase/adenosylcobinamide-phosphate guanylyltransferase n=1 Tax=Methylococcus sp. EFPC2 TaxID=2812648 RepID=UPI001967C40C|nr:bifunctional adenosylcobinamide kinase/adenosylcobinamide-phosphate guanylyltransferase [Methylococcus sp. EFPC2]QSA97906.1 bifunctional adenosylcobinamide kinase/adenosylcobinamide-phosphate guanylyltransferase [Methylococcus sp. EFPC2]